MLKPDHWIYQNVATVSVQARQQATEHQAMLTKPQGSLGLLEDVAIDFAGWQNKSKPSLEKICVRVFAADHGICRQGVSAFPQEVTSKMILNFLSGGAAISVLAKELKADFRVVNLGTVNTIEIGNDQKSEQEKYTDAAIAKGTQDFTNQAAMTASQLLKALDAGAAEVCQTDLFIGGEMGIGNTTSASAIYSVLLNLSPKETVGPGTGIDQDTQAHKAQLIEHAISLHKVSINSPLGILQCLGGFEIAALVGAYIKAAQQGIPILVDGFICTAAALLACKISPETRNWMIFSHQSGEPAHGFALDYLSARPLLKLNMRLGEGSGAAIAASTIKNALNLHANMATFTDAGVSDKDD